MSRRLVPAPRIVSSEAVAASADHRATEAAMAMFDRGGNAVDAAIAANAVLTVTAPHLCGLGGDLFALVHEGSDVHALNASGRAGSGADAGALRSTGFDAIPDRHHPAAVTIPGCVDGWIALHDRFGSLPLDVLFARAVSLAERGTPASPLLVGSLTTLDDRARDQLDELVSQARAPGAIVRRPGIARVLRSVGDGGRTPFYLGEFGDGLVDLTGEMITSEDLAQSQADWVGSLSAEVFGVRVHTIPPNSQGYLTLAIAGVMEELGVPDDPDSAEWLELAVRAAVVASHDRPEVLHERADGVALLETALRRARDPLPGIDTPTAAGDTTYLCTAQRDGQAVSLIQSNASGFGSWLVEPRTAINVQNRGIGFTLREGHPAELGPRRQPPHTLSPALVTGAGGRVRAVLGTMGGDAQPQILAQLLARTFVHGEHGAAAVAAPRWVLRGPSTGFDTWDGTAPPTVVVEDHASAAWNTAPGGFALRRTQAFSSEVGHAHAIVIGDGLLSAAADPRAVIGSAAGR